jgi:hypothetical protein
MREAVFQATHCARICGRREKASVALTGVEGKGVGLSIIITRPSLPFDSDLARDSPLRQRSDARCDCSYIGNAGNIYY